MIKKIVAVMLMAVLVLGIAACSDEKSESKPATEQKEVFKVGVILTGDNNEGDSKAHIDGIRQAAKKLSIDESQIQWEYTIKADEKSYDTAKKLADNGCDVIISNNRKYQEYMQKAAKEYPDADFVVIGGDTAMDCGLTNFHNAFTNIYQARYLTGIVAGMKIKELVENNELSNANFTDDGDVKIGYVGTLPGSEATSSYTAFYLGVKSVYENVSMCVQYTNKRSHYAYEVSTANQLIEQGCVMLVEHANLKGVYETIKSANEAGTLCYSVGFGDADESDNKEWMLVCAYNNWDVYYADAINLSMKNEEYDKDWVAGLKEGAVGISDISDSCCEETQQLVTETKEAIENEELEVFSTDNFKVNGKNVKSAYATDTDGDDVPDEDQAIFESAFHESYFRSAPYFSLDIDGIMVLN